MYEVKALRGLMSQPETEERDAQKQSSPAITRLRTHGDDAGGDIHSRRNQMGPEQSTRPDVMTRAEDGAPDRREALGSETGCPTPDASHEKREKAERKKRQPHARQILPFVGEVIP